MKPETATYLQNAHARLKSARANLAIGEPRVAAREAYLAAFDAAHALIFEGTSAIPKTHSGLRAVLRDELAKWPGVDPASTRFLAHGFQQKSRADYGPTSGPEAITDADAVEMLDGAARLIQQVEKAMRPTAVAPPDAG